MKPAPPSKKDGPPTAFDQFVLGLKTRSLAAFLGSLAVCALELAACFLFLEPKNIVRIDQRYLMETANDEYVPMSIQLLRMRQSKLEKIQVGYIGASQAARAIIDLNHPDNLSRLLSQRAGFPVEFDMLASAGQRFEDALAITDQFPPSFRGVLVMGVNDYKDDFRSKDPLQIRRHRDRILVVDAPSLLPFWREQGYTPRRTGVFFWDHLDFFAARRMAALRVSRVGTPRAVRLDERELEPNVDRRAAGEFADRAPAKLPDRSAAILTTSRRVIVTLLRNMKRRGVRVVFVQNPEVPERTARNLPRVERFHREFAAFASERGCAYWDFNPDLQFTQRDFPDDEHLGSLKGRRAFQAILVDKLGAYLRDELAGAGASPGVDRGEDDAAPAGPDADGADDEGPAGEGEE